MPYVHGARTSGEMVYVAGTLAIDPEGNSLHIGDVKAQTRYVIEQVIAVVWAAGGTSGDIVYNLIMLKRREDYASFTEVYREFFGTAPPPRYCHLRVGARGVPGRDRHHRARLSSIGPSSGDRRPFRPASETRSADSERNTGRRAALAR